VASASRVCSSVTVRILIGRPSAVRSLRKSIAHTSFGAEAVRWSGIRGPRRRRFVWVPKIRIRMAGGKARWRESAERSLPPIASAASSGFARTRAGVTA
jgi:hypothetical protein